MGWVTLTQRKAELKQQHIYYQNRDLQISREKRQMARRKMFETQTINTAQKRALRPLSSEYKNKKAEYNKEISELRKYLSLAQKRKNGEIDGIEKAANGQYQIFSENFNEDNADLVAINGTTENYYYVYKDNTANATGDVTEGIHYICDNNRFVNFTDENDNKQVDNGEITDCNNLPYYSTKDAAKEALVTKCLITPDMLVLNPDKTYSVLYDSKPIDTKYENIDAKNVTFAQTFNFDESKFDGVNFTDLSTITSETDLTGLETDIEDKIDELKELIDDATLEYQEEQNNIKTEFETELQMLEEESADEELQLDQEQMEVETLMENISNELQAISDAASQQMQGTTIKLA